MSPTVAGWGIEYWSNQHHHPIHPHHIHPLNPHHHERFQDQLAESMSDGMKLGGPEWVNHRMPLHHSPPVGQSHQHPHHLNGFMHPPHTYPPNTHPPVSVCTILCEWLAPVFV